MPDRSIKILVVDDEAAMRDILELRLRKWGFDVVLTGDPREVPDLLDRESPDVVLSDVVMPGMSGMDLLRTLKGRDPDRPIVLLTAHGTVEMAVEAMKGGALDFLEKPLNYPNLKAVLEEACRERRAPARAAPEASRPADGKGFGPFVGTSPPMLEVYELLRSMAESDAPVLITGESGTGKELAARTIHESSARRSGPFVAVNAAAIPRELVESEIFGHEKGAFTGASVERVGCFELADGGTLFLDEIGEMPLELQPKLLRVLDEARFRRVGGRQELTVDVRVLSATNRDPRASIRAGTLREDLYYRLNVLYLHLPPLRERKGDVPLLARHFLEVFGRKHGSPVRSLRDDTLELMERYRWPGNLREFRNVMERAAVLARNDQVGPSQLPVYVRHPERDATEATSLPTGLSVAEVEKQLILKTLEETGHNKTETARRLGVHVKTIRNKLRAYGLEG